MMHPGIVKARTVPLCPDAPLDPMFISGGKKLIPGVFCHGDLATNEDHYGMPMLMASHGYIVFHQLSKMVLLHISKKMERCATMMIYPKSTAQLL